MLLYLLLAISPVLSASFSLTQPVADSKFQVGTSVQILWTGGTPSSFVDLSLIDFVRWRVERTIVTKIPNTGSFSWTFPSTLDCNRTYQFYIQDNPRTTWTYGPLFTVTCLVYPPFAFLPTGSISPGANVSIAWSGGDPSWTVRLSLFSAGITVKDIVEAPNSNQIFTWTVPSDLDCSPNYQFFIRETQKLTPFLLGPPFLLNCSKFKFESLKSCSRILAGSQGTLKWTGGPSSTSTVQLSLIDLKSSLTVQTNQSSNTGRFLVNYAGSLACDRVYKWTINDVPRTTSASSPPIIIVCPPPGTNSVNGAPCTFGSQIFDFVIVGSGPSSGPLMRRLTEKGHTIAVLEKGPLFEHPDPSKKPDYAQTQPNFDDTFQVQQEIFSYEFNEGPPPTFVADGETQQEGTKRFHSGTKRKSLFDEALKVVPDYLERRGLDSSKKRTTEQRTADRKPLRHRAYPYAQVQGFGGNTLTYGGLNLRPSPEALNAWGNGFTFDEMLPYFRAVEKSNPFCAGQTQPTSSHNCGTMTGLLDTIEMNLTQFPPLVAPLPAFCQAGTSRWLDTTPGQIDYNDATLPSRAFCGAPQIWASTLQDQSGADICLIRGTIQSSYVNNSFLSQNPTLQICVNASVKRLILNSNNSVVAAELETGETVYGANFIVVAGVRHTPELLMRSGIGDPAVLAPYNITPQVAVPALGKFFHDEWAYALSYTVNNPDYWIPEPSSVRNRDQLYLIKWATGEQGENFTDVQLYLRLGNKLSLDEYLPGFIAGGTGPRTDNEAGFAIRVAMFQSDTFGNKSGVFPVGTNGEYVNRFVFRSNLFEEQGLMERFIEGALAGFEQAQAIIAQMIAQDSSLNITASAVTELLETAGREYDATKDNAAFLFALSDFGTVLALHGGGTCRIGKGDKGCVGPDLKVWGTQNLYVCDMSVFPSPVDANPTATLFALGEKLAAQTFTFPSKVSPNKTCLDFFPDGTPRFYQHYKGPFYQMISHKTYSHDTVVLPDGTSIDASKDSVAYISLYAYSYDFATRPFTEFFENVTINGRSIRRFAPVTYSELPPDAQAYVVQPILNTGKKRGTEGSCLFPSGSEVPPPSGQLTPGEIAGITIGSVSGFLLILLLFILVVVILTSRTSERI